MKIYTSRYGNKTLATNPAAKLGITVGAPRWPLPYTVTRCPQLAPDRSYLHAPLDEYRPQYLAKLEALGIEEIQAMFERASSQAGGADVILLCFEDLRKPEEWCHRRMFAAWYEGRTGIAIEELPEPALPPKAPRAIQALLFTF